MPIYHDVPQYSEEYDRLRLGIPTSSNFHKIITPQGKPSKQWREYACLLIAERILQHKIEFYNSPAMPQTQVEYWISGELSERFRPQLQGQLYVSKRSWVDILCWHDVLPKLVMRIEPDEKFIATLDRELRIFNYFIERVMEKVRVTTKLPIPAGNLALRSALRASLEIVP